MTTFAVVVATANKEVADRVKKAFHSLTGHVTTTSQDGVYLVETDSTEKVSRNGLQVVADGIVNNQGIVRCYHVANS